LQAPRGVVARCIISRSRALARTPSTPPPPPPPPPPRRNRFEMRIHKRIIDLHSPAEVVKQITAITIDPSVQVEVSVADAKQSK
jgi:hypothetical protein